MYLRPHLCILFLNMVHTSVQGGRGYNKRRANTTEVLKRYILFMWNIYNNSIIFCFVNKTCTIPLTVTTITYNTNIDTVF